MANGTGMRQPTMDTLIGEMPHAGTEEVGKDMQSTSEQSTDQKFQNAADTECGATDLQQPADYETRNVPGTECGTRWRNRSC